MVYELPQLDDVLENSPYFVESIQHAQSNSNQFYTYVKETEAALQHDIQSSKALNKSILTLSNVLQDASSLITQHGQALDKFSTGLTRIETYREMLITQTELLTLEPLALIGTQTQELMELSETLTKTEALLQNQTDKYCATKLTVQNEDHQTTQTYPKLCVDTLKLKQEHTLHKLEYVAKLRKYTSSNQLKYVQKMLEQMLAQYSYANFAYVVMSEMEPYLSELFTHLQTLHKSYNKQCAEDERVLDRTREEVKSKYQHQINVTLDTYPGSNTEVRNYSPLKSLLSFAGAGRTAAKMDYLSNKRDSFLSYINNDNLTTETVGATDEDAVETTDNDEISDGDPTRSEPKQRHNPFNKVDRPIEHDYVTVNTVTRSPNTGSRPSKVSPAPAARSSSPAPTAHSLLDSPGRSLHSSRSADDLTSDNLLTVSELRRASSDQDIVHTKVVRQRENTLSSGCDNENSAASHTSGYMYVRQKAALGHRWVQMYCTIEEDRLKGHVADTDKSIELEHLPTATVKPAGSEVDRNSCFYMISPHGTRCYQALTELDRQHWMKSLAQGTINALQSHGDQVARIRTINGNNRCADCDTRKPEWACIDHGTTICINCAGIHRSLGVNVSKVRSLLLDNWDEELIGYMETKGNLNFNKNYEHNIGDDKINDKVTREDRSAFIKQKYLEKRYHLERTADNG